jgi:hypothetical protein
MSDQDANYARIVVFLVANACKQDSAPVEEVSAVRYMTPKTSSDR